MQRQLTFGMASMFVLVMALSQARGQDGSPKAEAIKAVVHMNFGDADRQGKGLKNIDNILQAAPRTEIEVVCHGDGIGLVVQKQSKHVDQIQSLVKQGVRFVGCENTMKQKAISREELLSGVSTVPSGAVEILQKQQSGFAYFKP